MTAEPQPHHDAETKDRASWDEIALVHLKTYKEVALLCNGNEVLDEIELREVGDARDKTRISKHRNREVGRGLVEAASSVARYDPTMRALHRRLKAQGELDKGARIAATRNPLLIAHAIRENGKAFHVRGPGVQQELPSCSA